MLFFVNFSIMKCIEKVFTYWPNNLFTNQNEKNMDKKVISNGGKKNSSI